MAKSDKGKGPGPLAVAYLFIYNALCVAGWGCVLVLSAQHISDGRHEQMWPAVELPLKIVQTAAVLEVIHSMVGLVKSPWVTALMQVFSRVWTLWAVMNVSTEAQNTIFLTLAVTSWALVEVPRYTFYALNLLGAVPYPIFWLRYSLFAVLYPTGITGELGCMYMALIDLKGNNVSVQQLVANVPPQKLLLLAAILLVIITYVPGSPKMYMHMVKTRKKQFAELKGEKKA